MKIRLYHLPGKEHEGMRHEKKELYNVYRAGGREFCVYMEYDEQLDESYPAYPDFEKHPEYTVDGRPFATAVQESCPYCKTGVPEEPPPSDCGSCVWFYREGTSYDIIGICMCDARRRKSESGD